MHRTCFSTFAAVSLAMATAMIPIARAEAAPGIRKANEKPALGDYVQVPGLSAAEQAAAMMRHDTLVKGQLAVLQEQATLLTALEAEKHVPLAALQSLLASVASAGTLLHKDVATRLRAKADEYVILGAELEQPLVDQPDIAPARAKARALLSLGDLAGAEALFAKTRVELRAQHASQDDQAFAVAYQARIARLALRYQAAANLFSEAAVEARDLRRSWSYLFARGNAFYDRGRELNDEDALGDASAAFKNARDVARARRMDFEAGLAQARNADALRLSGERTDNLGILNQALGAYRDAIGDLTGTLKGATQRDLGDTLRDIGEREAGTDRLNEAIEAYKAALTEFPRQAAAAEWALTQNDLGDALFAVAQRTMDKEPLVRAVVAYRNAALVRTRERSPADWALTQNSLGSALASLGQRSKDLAMLDEAQGAFRAALGVRTEGGDPEGWAATQNNLGNALTNSGELGTGTERLNEAVSAYRLAQQVWTRDKSPDKWALAQSNLANTLTTLGDRQGGTGGLKNAVAAYRAALEVRTRDAMPSQWLSTEANLADALWRLGQRETGIATMQEAIEALDRCIAAAPYRATAEFAAALQARRSAVLAEIARRS